MYKLYTYQQNKGGYKYILQKIIEKYTLTNNFNTKSIWMHDLSTDIIILRQKFLLLAS